MPSLLAPVGPGHLLDVFNGILCIGVAEAQSELLCKGRAAEQGAAGRSMAGQAQQTACRAAAKPGVEMCAAG